MVQNKYRGWSQADLEALLRRAQQRAATGSLTESATAGTRFVKEYDQSAECVIEDVEYALYLLDPATWPLQPPSDRTKAIASN
ncbi:MAG: hypothetical protein JWQ04_1124 [Pedosphaera sp.]|nr:hypothetical protein [Pedosphaera sp.]